MIRIMFGFALCCFSVMQLTNANKIARPKIIKLDFIT